MVTDTKWLLSGRRCLPIVFYERFLVVGGNSRKTGKDKLAGKIKSYEVMSYDGRERNQ